MPIKGAFGKMWAYKDVGVKMDKIQDTSAGLKVWTGA